MLIKPQIVGVALCITCLSACTTTHNQSDSSFFHSYQEEGTPLYPDSYESTPTSTAIYHEEPPATPRGVAVPESYHVKTNGSPVTPKNADASWVSSQNAQGYTIELANSDKPLQVASAMSKAPKNERMAELKYLQGSDTYYMGLYGTYTNYEAAEQALNALPSDVKQSAGIKKWGSVQKITQ